MTATTTAQAVYQHYLAHLDGCRPCRVEQPCEAGDRLRRALRAARAAAMDPTNSRRDNGGL
ncbi:hypothetical protein AB0I94_02475 [Streptomyces sp. NPDC050147]|uniref:hypothetical protein n=1 Tax=Streptomyces sp. NPDC050147 TaxID=3155513 RepID=UPI003418901F